MKTLLSSFLATLAVGLLAVVPPVLAETPDGVTPANEGVCDDLIGSTPGLYGLCVAFCEAQDHADLIVAITEEDLEALEASAPSGRILENYNRRKQDTDPSMPCLKVEEPCPCWSIDELQTIDGTMYSGSSADFFICNDTVVNSSILESRGPSSTSAQAREDSGFCRFLSANNHDMSGGSSESILRWIYLGEEGLTAEKLAICKTQISEWIEQTTCTP
jgi:hypothetical protein